MLEGVEAHAAPVADPEGLDLGDLGIGPQRGPGRELGRFLGTMIRLAKADAGVVRVLTSDYLDITDPEALRLLLLTRGWEPYPKDSVRWGENGVCTWYFKGEFPEHPGRVADVLENERLMLEVGRDFAD